MLRRTVLCVALVLGAARSSYAQDAAALYKDLCASCHDAGADRAPNRQALGAMSPERVLQAMETGSMISMATGRSVAERRSIAEYLTGQSLAAALSMAPPPRAFCQSGGTPPALSSAIVWNGWGQNVLNTRFQTGAAAGLTATTVPRLQLKWAFAFPGDLWANAHPTIAGDRVFVGSAGGLVYSLSAATGCVHWFFEAGAPVRTAISIGRIGAGSAAREIAFFGDAKGNAFAVDAVSGRPVWKTTVESFPYARLTGSPVLHRGRLWACYARRQIFAPTAA